MEVESIQNMSSSTYFKSRVKNPYQFKGSFTLRDIEDENSQKKQGTVSKAEILKQILMHKQWKILSEEFERMEHTVQTVTEGVEKEGGTKPEEPEVEKKEELASILEGATIMNELVDLLVSETMKAVYPSGEFDDTGNEKQDLYLTMITEEGICCTKQGSPDCIWELKFTDSKQYQKAMEFVEWSSDKIDNYRYAAHENFWRDYLSGRMDVEGFKSFLETTNRGVPDYNITNEHGMFVDIEKVQWAKYLNPLGTHIYSSVDMMDMGFANKANGFLYSSEIQEWEDEKTGVRIELHKPVAFDEKRPIYYLNIWNKDGEMVQRIVDVMSVNKNDCDLYEKYVYLIHFGQTREEPSTELQMKLRVLHNEDEL